MSTTHQDMINTTRRAMLERYLSNPTDAAWEQLKYDLYREAQAHGAQGGFPITSVAREDLEYKGFDTSNVTDEQMAEIADHMQDAYCDDAFWVELEVIAEDMGIPRPEKANEESTRSSKAITTMENVYKDERARAQAGAQLASIEELVKCLEHAETCTDTDCGADCPHDADEARQTIMGDALDVQVRGEWHTPGAIDGCAPYEYKVLLCWGGPAVQILGTLDDSNQPDSARLQYQDWFTEWMNYPLTDAEEQTLITYAQQLYFEG